MRTATITKKPLGRRLAAAPLLLALFGSAGCKREAVTYAVSIDVARLPRSAARHLIFRGQEVPVTLDNDGHTLQASFTAPGEQWLSGEIAALHLDLETPCGPRVFPYKSIAPSPEIEAQWVLGSEKKYRPGGAPVALDFHLDEPPVTVLVHVDRRGAESAEVALGKQPLKRGAGLPPRPFTTPRADVQGDVYEVAVPSACADGADVSIAGQKVGRVGATGLHAHVMIDVKGGHCYDRTSFNYGTPAMGGAAFLKPQTERISGQRVFVSEDGTNPDDTDSVFPLCPSLQNGRVSCAEIAPTPCDLPPP